MIRFIPVLHNTQNSTFQLLFVSLLSAFALSAVFNCGGRAGRLIEKYKNREFCISFSQVNVVCLNTADCSHPLSSIVSSLLFFSPPSPFYLSSDFLSFSLLFFPCVLLSYRLSFNCLVFASPGLSGLTLYRRSADRFI